jgi:hypothetical protein
MIQYQNIMEKQIDEKDVKNLNELFQTLNTVNYILEKATITFDQEYQRFTQLLSSISDPHLKKKLAISMECLKKDYELINKRFEVYRAYYSTYLKMFVDDMHFLEIVSDDLSNPNMSSTDKKNFHNILGIALNISERIQTYLITPIYKFSIKFEQLFSTSHDKPETIIKLLNEFNQQINQIHDELTENHPKFLVDWNKFLDLQPIIEKFTSDYSKANPKQA